MSVEIRVPSVGESVSEATVLRWLKKVGETVAAGEDVVELETDKANTAVAAESPGVLEKIVRQEGETVGINDVLGLLREGPAASNGKLSTPPEPSPKSAAPEESAAPHTRSTPLAARVAAETGVDLTSVSGSGSGGRIVSADVKNAIMGSASNQPAPPLAAPAPPPTSHAAAPKGDGTGPRREERIPMSRMRRVIAERLKEAQNTAAMLTTFNEVDLTAIMDLRKRRNELFEKRYGVKLGFMSFFTKASIGALKAFPYLNAEIQGGDIILKHYYDIGVAVGSSEGLVVPVVHDADRKSFADIEKEIKSLAERARDKKLAVSDLLGGTFTITNGGIFGSLMSTPILNYPQVGILGMHKIQDRPVVVDGQVAIRPMMYLALSYDHRIVDGSDAVRFLVRIKELVEDPETLLLEG
jgi:2-oxoglutarate dehydrogenase E2 component (dihydrolipoamide succinyltransferase)